MLWVCDNVYNIRNDMLFFRNYILKNSVAKLWNIGITTMFFEKVFMVNDKNHILYLPSYVKKNLECKNYMQKTDF